MARIAAKAGAGKGAAHRVLAADSPAQVVGHAAAGRASLREALAVAVYRLRRNTAPAGGAVDERRRERSGHRRHASLA